MECVYTRKEGRTDYAYRLGGTEGCWEVCHFYRYELDDGMSNYIYFVRGI